MDLSAFSHGELQKLRTRIEKEIEVRNKKQRAQAMDEIKVIVAKYGLKIEDVITNPVTRKRRKDITKVAVLSAKKSAAILYRHPDNPQFIWTGGRGRPPQWIKVWKASGRSLDEARVITE